MAPNGDKLEYKVIQLYNEFKIEFTGHSLNPNYGYINQDDIIKHPEELYTILNKHQFLKDKIRDIKINQILQNDN